MTSLRHLFLGLFSNIPNCSFSKFILEMGIYSTIFVVLFILLTISYEGIVGKTAFVIMTILDMQIMAFWQSFKAFDYDCFLWANVYMRYPYHCIEKWSSKMVAVLYLLLVSFPLSWAMNPTGMQKFLSMDEHATVLMPWRQVCYGLGTILSSMVTCSTFSKGIQHMFMAWPLQGT